MVRMKWPSVPETLSHCLFFALLCSTVKGSCVHPEYNPQKVRFNSTNLWHYVTWEPPRQMGSNMTYTVEYLKSGDTWRRVSDCTNIVRTRCDLRLTDEHCEYWARVQVVWVGSGCSSEWVYTDCFYPLLDTDLKVLQFNVAYSDGIFVTTIMDSPTPHTKDGVVMTVRYFFPDLEYKVTCQETGTDKMTSLVSKEMDETGMETKRTVTLPVPELGREYCFNATPVLWLNRGKCSHSEQKCLKTHSPYAYLTWKCLLAVVLAGVVFTVCVTGILLYRYIHPNDKTFPKGLLDLDNLPKRNHDLASTQSEDESSISTVTEISSCITSSITTTSELLCSSLGIEEDEEETDTTFVEPYRSRMLISQSGDVVRNWDAPSVNCNYSMACSISKGLVSDSENSDGALHAVSEAQALKMLQSLVISGEHLCNKAKQEKCCENDKDFRKELCNSYATVTVVNEV